MAMEIIAGGMDQQDYYRQLFTVSRRRIRTIAYTKHDYYRRSIFVKMALVAGVVYHACSIVNSFRRKVKRSPYLLKGSAR